MVFERFLDPVFSPLLNMDALLSVGIVALLVSLIITLIYKYTTDQNLMKRLKDEMKELQTEMKTLRDHPEKMMQVQKQAMQSNMKYMTQSMKSTLYTFLPIIVIFAWMNAHYAFEPILPGQQFSATLEFAKGSIGEVTVLVPQGLTAVGETVQPIAGDKATFTFKGMEGKYTESNALAFSFENRTFYKDVWVTQEQEYAVKDTKLKGNPKLITLNYEKKHILPLIGWGWLGTYILFSVVFSMVLRKWMKIY